MLILMRKTTTLFRWTQGKLKPLKEVPNNAPVKEVYKVPEKPKKQDSASVTIPKNCGIYRSSVC